MGKWRRRGAGGKGMVFACTQQITGSLACCRSSSLCTAACKPRDTLGRCMPSWKDSGGCNRASTQLEGQRGSHA